MKSILTLMLLIGATTLMAQYPCLLCPQEIPESYNAPTTSKALPGTDIGEQTEAVCMYGICEAVYSKLINAGRRYIAMPIGNGKYAYFRKWEFYQTYEEAKARLEQLKSKRAIGNDAFVRPVFGMIGFK